jgi:glycerol-3-phosphate O-acyltransferase
LNSYFLGISNCNAEVSYNGGFINNASHFISLFINFFGKVKKIEVLKREKLNHVFYAIKSERRVEVLYHKNMILHHFLVSGIINSTWFNVFNGSIKDGMSLTRFLQAKRKELKYEFHLPTVKEMIREALNIISYALGRRVESIEECMKLSSQELYQIATKVRRFSTALSYLYEAYYISSLTVKYLANENFNQERFVQVAKELFDLEIERNKYHPN